jgi:hypothetical protein
MQKNTVKTCTWKPTLTLDTQTCENGTLLYENHKHACGLLKNIFDKTCSFLKHTNEFDFHTHECDLYTQSVISTYTSVTHNCDFWGLAQMLFLHAKCDLQTHKCDFHTHTVIFKHTREWFSPVRVWFLHAKCDLQTHKSDFHTHSMIFKRKSAISTLTIVNKTRTGVIYIRKSVTSTQCVWF